MELGYLAAAVGLNLLMRSYRFKRPVPEVLRPGACDRRAADHLCSATDDHGAALVRPVKNKGGSREIDTIIGGFRSADSCRGSAGVRSGSTRRLSALALGPM